MSPHCLYRHKANKDVAIRVVTRFYIKEKKCVSLRVEWWNIGVCHDPFYMGISQRLTIGDEHRADWIPMEMDERCPPLQHVAWQP